MQTHWYSLIWVTVFSSIFISTNLEWVNTTTRVILATTTGDNERTKIVTRCCLSNDPKGRDHCSTMVNTNEMVYIYLGIYIYTYTDQCRAHIYTSNKMLMKRMIHMKYARQVSKIFFSFLGDDISFMYLPIHTPNYWKLATNDLWAICPIKETATASFSLF